MSGWRAWWRGMGLWAWLNVALILVCLVLAVPALRNAAGLAG